VAGVGGGADENQGRGRVVSTRIEGEGERHRAESEERPVVVDERRRWPMSRRPVRAAGMEVGVVAWAAGVKAAANPRPVAWMSPVAGMDKVGACSWCGVGGGRCNIGGHWSRKRQAVVCRWAAGSGKWVRWAVAGAARVQICVIGCARGG
jgi:hypothetical protein